MVRSSLNNRKKRSAKLVRMLIAGNKKLLFISMLSVVIGFSFLFAVSSLTQTIIKTMQADVVSKYGKFLMVIPDISADDEKKIEAKYDQFQYEQYYMEGNVEIDQKEIALGAMDKTMGENLGFRLVRGNWPETSDQIVVEEYVLERLHREKEAFPIRVSLSLPEDAGSAEYEITGVISNYSYLLSTATDGKVDIKPYPSIIHGAEPSLRARETLVILQKTLDLKQADTDIQTVLGDGWYDHMCINERLYGGYEDTIDLVHIRLAYIVLLNMVLIMEQIVVIRAFLLRNRKTFYLLEAMGMTRRERRRLTVFLVQGYIWVGFFISWLLAEVSWNLWMRLAFDGYGGQYSFSLHVMLLVEGLIAAVVLGGFSVWEMSGADVAIIGGMTAVSAGTSKKYRFKKFDPGIVIMQVICIVFTMFTFYGVNSFQINHGDIRYSAISRRDSGYDDLHGYRIALYGDNYFSFQELEPLLEYGDQVALTMEAETFASTVLLDKDCSDPYFTPYYMEKKKMSYKDRTLWKMIADDADQYKPLDALEVSFQVLPEHAFQKFLKKYDIDSEGLEQGEQKACVMLLPDYQQSGDASSSLQMDHIVLGRVRGDEQKVTFEKERFALGAVRSCDGEEYSHIQIVMSEETAKKSTLVVGYQDIEATMKRDIPEPVKKTVQTEIMRLATSVQGGLMGSSELAEEQDAVLRNYVPVLSVSMQIFCALIIVVYIVLNTYIEWEKHSYEYGMLRSFGMSYGTLHHNLFQRYFNGILAAVIPSLLIGQALFTEEGVSRPQIMMSFAVTVGITYLSRGVLYFWKRKQQISSMIGR